MRMNFSQDSLAETEGLLAVNRGFCKMKIAKKTPRSVPLNCAALPQLKPDTEGYKTGQKAAEKYDKAIPHK